MVSVFMYFLSTIKNAIGSIGTQANLTFLISGHSIPEWTRTQGWENIRRDCVGAKEIKGGLSFVQELRPQPRSQCERGGHTVGTTGPRLGVETVQERPMDCSSAKLITGAMPRISHRHAHVHGHTHRVHFMLAMIVSGYQNWTFFFLLPSSYFLYCLIFFYEHR